MSIIKSTNTGKIKFSINKEDLKILGFSDVLKSPKKDGREAWDIDINFLNYYLTKYIYKHTGSSFRVWYSNTDKDVLIYDFMNCSVGHDGHKIVKIDNIFSLIEFLKAKRWQIEENALKEILKAK